MFAILLATLGPDSSQREWVLAAMKRHEASLLRFASAIVGPDDARDMVQETFLELCRADRATVDPHLVQWLFTVCRNRAISQKRKARRHTDVEETMSLASTEAGPHTALERKQAEESIASLIAGLPERSREVVALKFGGGLSYKEIADVTGLSVSHVGVILHEAIKSVRERFSKLEGKPSLALGRS
jgi:RNA polymerase sigma factor (sigma-70 family)